MLDVAIKVAEANPIQNLPPMSALLVDTRGKVVAVGMNRRKSHPLQKSYAPNPKAILLHAEIDAIKRALRTHTREEIATMTMYIARVGKKGLPAKAKPCIGCARALEDFGIKQVHWTEDQV
jgi:tRNA(Arg) A34 adenosine deaminase TadA